MVMERLKTGDFNNMTQATQPNDSVLVVLTKRGDSRIYKMLIRNLYETDEEVLWEEILPKE